MSVRRPGCRPDVPSRTGDQLDAVPQPDIAFLRTGRAQTTARLEPGYTARQRPSRCWALEPGVTTRDFPLRPPRRMARFILVRRRGNGSFLDFARAGF